MTDDRPRTDPILRELARRIQEETDPDKMIELVRELIARYDEQRLRQELPPAESRGRAGFRRA
jgi:hypothetical protein